MQIDFDSPMPEWLRDILGRPNFACGQIAHQLRRAGASIREKAEDEQAAVIWWLLGFAAKHGEGWREPAAAELQRLIREFPPPDPVPVPGPPNPPRPVRRTEVG